MPEAKELAEFVRPEFEKLGLKVFEISTASTRGHRELNFALSALVHEMREVANPRAGRRGSSRGHQAIGDQRAAVRVVLTRAAVP